MRVEFDRGWTSVTAGSGKALLELVTDGDDTAEPEAKPEPEPELEPQLAPKPQPDMSPAPARGARSKAGRFQVGDKVQRRDGTEAWAVGFVTQLEPLKVNMSATDPSEKGYKWDEVRPYEPAGEPESKPQREVQPEPEPFAEPEPEQGAGPGPGQVPGPGPTTARS